MQDSNKLQPQRFEENELKSKLSEFESEERYRHIFENSPIGIYTTTPDGRILSANPSLVKMLAYDSFEELAKRDLENDSYENLSESRADFKRKLEEKGQLTGYENAWLRKDGKVIYVRENAAIVKGSNGEVYYQGTVEDITEKKLLEKQLKDGEIRFRSLIQNSSDVICLLNSEGQITYVSQSVSNVVGYSPEEMLNTSGFDLVHPDYVLYVVNLFGQLLNDSGQTVSAQIKMLHKNGNYLWVDATATNMLSEPAVNAIVVNYRNIDLKKKAMLKLQESESRYRALANNFPNGFVILFDNEMRLLVVEGAEIARLDLSREKMEGKAIYESMPKEICNLIVPHWKSTLQGNHEVFEITALKNIYELRTLPIRNESGDITAGLAVVQNITERKEIEKELKDLNESKDKFFSIISHDLKGPFTSLLGFSEFLANDFDELTSDEVRSFAMNINKSARSVFNLLENLLQWSRLKTGRMEFSPTRFDLNELLEQNINIYEISAVKKNINIHYESRRDLYVFADSYMTDTIIRNFLSNAVKFTNHGGQVRLSAEQDSSSVRITVADNGIGISADDMHKLFKAGENISTLGTGKEKGTGLGLILCKEFIDKNDGELFIESQPGKGTSFTFTLPLSR